MQREGGDKLGDIFFSSIVLLIFLVIIQTSCVYEVYDEINN